MKAALRVVTSRNRKSLKEIEAEYENYSGFDPEDPLPEPSSPWESFAEKWSFTFFLICPTLAQIFFFQLSVQFHNPVTCSMGK